MAHTSGPWRLSQASLDGFTPVMAQGGVIVALISTLSGNAKDDGPLIAAAPTLREACAWIDGEAPASEPSDVPTVGFHGDPRDPDDAAEAANDVVAEAFQEGVAWGLWLAAEKARAALAAAQPN